MIFHALNDQNFTGILEAIKQIADARERAEQIRLFMPMLLQRIPELTMMNFNGFRDVNLSQLVPSFFDIRQSSS